MKYTLAFLKTLYPTEAVETNTGLPGKGIDDDNFHNDVNIPIQSTLFDNTPTPFYNVRDHSHSVLGYVRRAGKWPIGGIKWYGQNTTTWETIQGRLGYGPGGTGWDNDQKPIKGKLLINGYKNLGKQNTDPSFGLFIPVLPIITLDQNSYPIVVGPGPVESSVISGVGDFLGDEFLTIDGTNLYCVTLDNIRAHDAGAVTSQGPTPYPEKGTIPRAFISGGVTREDNSVCLGSNSFSFTRSGINWIVDFPKGYELGVGVAWRRQFVSASSDPPGFIDVSNVLISDPSVNGIVYVPFNTDPFYQGLDAITITQTWACINYGDIPY